jgi:hypothetical protein
MKNSKKEQRERAFAWRSDPQQKKDFEAIEKETRGVDPNSDYLKIIAPQVGSINFFLWTLTHRCNSPKAFSLLSLLGRANIDQPYKSKLIYPSKLIKKQRSFTEKAVRAAWDVPPEDGIIYNDPLVYSALSGADFDTTFLLLIEGASLSGRCQCIHYREDKVAKSESNIDQTLLSYIQENKDSKKHYNSKRKICIFADKIIQEVLPTLVKLQKDTQPDNPSAIKTNRVQSKQKGKQKQIIQNTNKQEPVKDRVKAIKALASFYRTNVKAYAETSDVIKIHLLTRAMKLYQQAVVLLQAEIKRLKAIKTKHAQLVRKMKASTMNESTTAILQQSQFLPGNGQGNDELGITAYNNLLIQCQTQRDACFIELKAIGEHDSKNEYLGYWTLATGEIPRPQLAQKQTPHPVVAVVAYVLNGFCNFFTSSSSTTLTYDMPKNQY